MGTRTARAMPQLCYREQPLPDLPMSLLGPEAGDPLGAGSTHAQLAPMVMVPADNAAGGAVWDKRPGAQMV